MDLGNFRHSSLLQYSVSKPEAKFYYLGLPSGPGLVTYCMGTTPWTKPTGVKAYRELKEHRPAFGHKLNTIWKDLGPKGLRLPGFHGGLVDDRRCCSLCQGQRGRGHRSCRTLDWDRSRDSAARTAHSCLDLLKEFEITNIEVEHRESESMSDPQSYHFWCWHRRVH